MDSISQFVLGAAVGEAVLGKKLGNKAMILGGIGGTIPDLDILASPFMSEVDALAFHRGISHSIFFSVVGGLFFGWLAFQFYKWRWKGKEDNVDINQLQFQIMFFLAFFTHALLDAFTMYGTQLFAPFTTYRIAFSTISVADPMYTLPFLICLIVAAFYAKHRSKRAWWNWAGIVWSCLYLTFTVFNKVYVTGQFESQLAEQGIEYTKQIIGPTILNNVLWSTTVESDSTYYQGQFSLFDRSPIEFKPIVKNHSLIKNSEDRTVNILKWFSDGFYNLMVRSDGRLQFNDLRYGTFKGTGKGENDYIFRFILEKQEESKYTMTEAKGGPEPGDEKKLMQDLWNRIKGR